MPNTKCYKIFPFKTPNLNTRKPEKFTQLQPTALIESRLPKLLVLTQDFAKESAISLDA